MWPKRISVYQTYTNWSLGLKTAADAVGDGITKIPGTELVEWGKGGDEIRKQLTYFGKGRDLGK